MRRLSGDGNFLPQRKQETLTRLTGLAAIGFFSDMGSLLTLYRFHSRSDPFFHNLPGLESDSFAAWHVNRSPRLWIPRQPCFPLAHLEDAEVAQFQPPFRNQNVNDAVYAKLCINGIMLTS